MKVALDENIADWMAGTRTKTHTKPENVTYPVFVLVLLPVLDIGIFEILELLEGSIIP